MATILKLETSNIAQNVRKKIVYPVLRKHYVNPMSLYVVVLGRIHFLLYFVSQCQQKIFQIAISTVKRL